MRCVRWQRSATYWESGGAPARASRPVHDARGRARAVPPLRAPRAGAAVRSATGKGDGRRRGSGCGREGAGRRRHVDEHRWCGTRRVAHREALGARARSAGARPRATVSPPSEPSGRRRSAERAPASLVGGLGGARTMVRHGDGGGDDRLASVHFRGATPSLDALGPLRGGSGRSTPIRRARGSVVPRSGPAVPWSSDRHAEFGHAPLSPHAACRSVPRRR